MGRTTTPIALLAEPGLASQAARADPLVEALTGELTRRARSGCWGRWFPKREPQGMREVAALSLLVPAGGGTLGHMQGEPCGAQET